MSPQEILGRVTMASEPDKARVIISQFRNTLKHPKYVEQVHAAVQESFLQEDADVRRLIFIACVYQLYQPLSYLRRKEDDKASGKLPIGVRDEMQKCLAFVNPEMVNFYKQYTEPQMKPENNGVIRPFKQKVMSIVERFKCFSINPDDSQFTLSL